MVQVGSLTTRESVRLAKHAEKCGVDAISSVGPIYYTGNADAALKHYQGIAEATHLPFFPYQLGDASLPGNIHSFIDRLLEIPNITGMKLTTNQLVDISAVHNYAGGRLKLFSGSDELFCHASLCGTVGAIGSFYNIWGVSCRHVMEEFRGGNFQLGKEFMLTFQQMIRVVLPNIWTFFRKAMQLKYQIDIGPSIAPLGNTQREWNEKDVRAIMAQVDVITGS
jgi:N-acetylneuraminate lyase